jgi:hypothetical protein
MWASHDNITGNVTIGMDSLGLASLGDLAYVSLQPVGTKVTRGEAGKYSFGLNQDRVETRTMLDGVDHQLRGFGVRFDQCRIAESAPP